MDDDDDEVRKRIEALRSIEIQDEEEEQQPVKEESLDDTRNSAEDQPVNEDKPEQEEAGSAEHTD